MRPGSAKVQFRIATRGSALALAQAQTVLDACRRGFPHLTFELRVLRTTGDRLQSASLRNAPSSLPKGLFTKELEVALANGDADLAVHSLKDLPTALPAGLRLGAVLPREEVRDVLVTRASSDRGRPRRSLGDLPRGAVVATSSTRRAAQVLVSRPDLRCVEIRGNVPTRLRKLATHSGIEATILAAAGLIRLGIGFDSNGLLEAPESLAPEGWGAPLQASVMEIEQMLPAPGQAAIGLECRRGDVLAARICRHLNDATSRVCVEAERAFLAAFGGGCQSPVAALARLDSDATLILEAKVFDGDRRWSKSAEGDAKHPRALGSRLGREARRALLGG